MLSGPNTPRTPRTAGSARYRPGSVAPDCLSAHNSKQLSRQSAWATEPDESSSDSGCLDEGCSSTSIEIGGTEVRKFELRKRRSVKLSLGIIEKDEHDDHDGPLILAPDSLFVTIWLSILTCLITFIMLSLPFNAAFHRESLTLTLTFALIDVFFMLDIVRKFRTAFMDEGQLVRDPLRIRRQYLRGSFAFDLICAIPLDMIRLWEPEAPVLIGANKLLGFVVIVLLLDDLEKSRDANPFLIRLFKLFIYSIMLCHYVACGWFWFSSYQGFGSDLWAPTSDLQDAPVTTQYLHSMHFAVGLMFNESDIAVPSHSLGTWFSLTVSLLSILFLSYMVGSLQTLLHLVDNSAGENERRWHYCQKFLRKYKIPSSIQIKVRRYYEFIRSKQVGIMNNPLLTNLPLSIRCNITMYVLQDMLSSLEWLKSLSPAACRAVICGLRQRFTIAEEIIYQQSSNSYNLFLIKSGGIALLYHDNFGRVTRVGVLGTGSVFGETAAFQASPYPTSAMTLSGCEIYELPRETLIDIARLYPNDYAIMLEHFNSSFALISTQIDRIQKEAVALGDQLIPRKRWAKIRSAVIMMSVRHQGLQYYVWKISYFLRYSTINPINPFWIRWQNIVMVIVNFNIFRLPLMVLSNWNFTAVTSIFIFNYAFDTILMIDILLRFRLWTLKRNGASETDPRELERTYIKSADFMILLLSSLPFNWISPNNYWSYINKLLRFPQLYKLLRFQLSFYLDRSLARLITLFLYFIMLNHFVSCAYLMFARLDANSSHIFNLPKQLSESDPLFSRYTQAALFSFKMLLRLGPTIRPESNSELLFTISCTILGLFVTAFFIGHVSALITEIDLLSSMFQNRVRKMETLLDRCHVPHELKAEAYRYMQHQWQSTDGIDHDRILEDLPQSLRQDIMMHICGKQLSKAPLFDMMSNQLFREVVGYLRFFSVPAGQFVFQAGDTAQSMFLILKGKVGLIFPGETKPGKFLSQGTCFGEMAMLTNALRTASIIAEEPVLLLSLSKDDFNQIFADHPEFVRNIKKVVEQRMNHHIKQDAERGRSLSLVENEKRN